MAYFRAILVSALFAGVLAGAALTGLQTLKVYPLILAAEEFENKGHDHAVHAPSNPNPSSSTSSSPSFNSGQDKDTGTWMPADGGERLFYSLLSNVLIGVGLGLVLAAMFALRDVTDWRQGVAWGLGGFIAVSLAPALGLPPELPGMAAGDLLARQTWWFATALLTAGGMALIFLSDGPIWRVSGVVVAALPHIYGAPHPATLDSNVPAILAAEFATASLASNLIFWVILGALAAETMARLDRAGNSEFG
ncbi:MAG: CbtA family protein [Alphaproteobacteria bacterium]|nr:CbtA family protein [Alphaproteobacteria bacterium]